MAGSIVPIASVAASMKARVAARGQQDDFVQNGSSPRAPAG
jgi:hypothetical protein